MVFWKDLRMLWFLCNYMGIGSVFFDMYKELLLFNVCYEIFIFVFCKLFYVFLIFVYLILELNLNESIFLLIYIN